MNSIRLFSTFAVVAFLAIALSGCGNKKDSQAKNEAPAEGYPIVNQAIARKDITEQARAQLRRYNKGITAPKEALINRIVSRAVETNRQKRFKLEVKQGFDGVFFDIAPTYSERPEGDRSVDYALAPKNCKEFNASLLRCRSAATEHFRKVFHDLPQDELSALCDFFDATVNFEIYRPTKKRVEQFTRQYQQLKIPDLVANDPWLRLCRAYADYHISKNYERSSREANATLEEFAKTDYPAQSIWQAHNYCFEVRNAWRLFQSDDSKNAIRRSHLRKYADIIYCSLSVDFRAKDDELRALWFMFDESFDFLARRQQHEIIEALCIKLLESKKVDPWFKAMIRGRLAVYRAWKSRGDGYANTVSDEGWRGFQSNMKIAESSFKKAFRLNPHAPESIEGLQTAAFTGQAEESGDFWMKKALELQPDFYPVIRSSIHFNRPRWGGSLKRMLNTGEQFSRQGEFDSIAPYAFIDAFAYAVTDEHCLEDGPIHEQLGAAQLKRLRECAISLSRNEEIHGHGYVLSREWMQSCAFAFGYLAGDQALILKDYERMGGEYADDAAAALQVFIDPKRLYEQALAVHGPFAPLYEELANYQRMEHQELIKNRTNVRNLKAKARADGAEQQVLTSIQRILNRADYFEKYETGGWVPLSFDKSLTDWWSSTTDSLKYESDDSAIFRGNTDEAENMFYMYHPFPGPRSIEFKVTWLTDISEIPPNVSTGFWPLGFKERGSIFCGLNPNSKQLRYGSPEAHYWQRKVDWVVALEGVGAPFKDMKSVKMRFNIHEHYYEFFINDKFVLSQRNEEFYPAPVMSFGNPFNHPGNYEVRFSEIRIKKWTDNPPPVDANERLTYFEELTKKYPESKRFWRLRGKSAHSMNQFELAKEYFNKAAALGDTSIELNYYLGDLADRENQIERAMEHYWTAVNVSDEVSFRTLGSPSKPRGTTLASEACFRYYWLAYVYASRPGVQVQQPENNLRPKTSAQWANFCLAAAQTAINKNYEHASQLMERAIKEAPDTYKELAKNQDAKYQNNEPYLLKRADRRFYLDEPQLPHFPKDVFQFPKMEGEEENNSKSSENEGSKSGQSSQGSEF